MFAGFLLAYLRLGKINPLPERSPPPIELFFHINAFIPHTLRQHSIAFPQPFPDCPKKNFRHRSATLFYRHHAPRLLDQHTANANAAVCTGTHPS